jgi:cell wall-associated NlpC family hydrolase
VRLASKPATPSQRPPSRFQNLALNPGNGGQLVDGAALKPGDIILTADNGLKSSGIRLATLSPVSHAAVYLGDSQVVEAVGEGIRRRTVADLVAEEVTVVAFRHPGITAEHMSAR